MQRPLLSKDDNDKIRVVTCTVSHEYLCQHTVGMHTKDKISQMFTWKVYLMFVILSMRDWAEHISVSMSIDINIVLSKNVHVRVGGVVKSHNEALPWPKKRVKDWVCYEYSHIIIPRKTSMQHIMNDIMNLGFSMIFSFIPHFYFKLIRIVGNSLKQRHQHLQEGYIKNSKGQPKRPPALADLTGNSPEPPRTYVGHCWSTLRFHLFNLSA